MRSYYRPTSLLRFLALGMATTAMLPVAAAASPCVAIALTARPQDRPALLADVNGPQLALLNHWRAAGLVTRYRVFFTRGADQGVWDAMIFLTFGDDTAMSRWRSTLTAGTGGVAREALSHAASVDTTPCDSIRAGGPNKATKPATLVVPYLAMVPPGQYADYLDGYTIPQFRGWIDDGVLDSFEIVTSRYPAGRPWNATIFLRYKDDAALAQRERETARTRERLAAVPSWKAFSDSKKSVRSEGKLAVADEIAASD